MSRLDRRSEQGMNVRPLRRSPVEASFKTSFTKKTIPGVTYSTSHLKPAEKRQSTKHNEPQRSLTGVVNPLED